MIRAYAKQRSPVHKEPRPEGGWFDSDTKVDLVSGTAGTLDEVARVHLPQRVPFGFHGNWLPASVDTISAPFRMRRAFGG